MMGARIAALRRRAGLSQAALAEKLRCSPSAVGMYEQGRREPAGETLVRLAEIFGVSTDYLLTGQARLEQDREALTGTLLRSLGVAEERLAQRTDKPFTRQELAVLVASLLLES